MAVDRAPIVLELRGQVDGGAIAILLLPDVAGSVLNGRREEGHQTDEGTSHASLDDPEPRSVSPLREGLGLSDDRNFEAASKKEKLLQ